MYKVQDNIQQSPEPPPRVVHKASCVQAAISDNLATSETVVFAMESLVPKLLLWALGSKNKNTRNNHKNDNDEDDSNETKYLVVRT